MDQFSNSVAAHLRTNESEMTPRGALAKIFAYVSDSQDMVFFGVKLSSDVFDEFSLHC